MLGTSYFNPNATSTANRFQLHVQGQNFSDRTDVKLGAVSISLQGPGGQSTMRFTVERTCPANGTMSPFRGRAPVYFSDSLSDLKFRGFIVHTSFRRSQGSKQVIDVDVAGLEKQLDERLVTAFNTRTDTSGRARKIDHDDNIVRGILQTGSMLGMADGGFIQLTNSAMDDMAFKRQTVRECLDEVCDIAQEPAQYQTRRYYVDAIGQLHYYSGMEGLPAPFRVDEDTRYLKTMFQASGIVSFWSGRRENNGSDIADHLNNATGLVAGGVSTDNSLCINDPELPGMRLNGINGYFGPSANNLHPGNTGSWGIVFKRRSTGSAQTLISGGTNDILIGFDSTDHLIVQKEGTGNMFVSNATYVNTAKSYHLVVTHSPANDTLVYVNGDAVTGSTTSRTLVAGSAAINVGRSKSGANNYFAGTVWGAWVSSSEMTPTNAAVQFRAWSSIEPENLTIDRDSSDVTLKVWVTASKAVDNIGDPKSAWVYFNDAGDPNFEQVVTNDQGGPLQPSEFLDAPDADTVNKRKKYGHSYMAAKAGTVVSASFSLSYDPAIVQVGSASTWTPGQTVYITSNDALGFSAKALEVKQVDIDLLNATGEVRYDITAGALAYSGLRHMRARSRGMA